MIHSIRQLPTTAQDHTSANLRMEPRVNTCPTELCTDKLHRASPALDICADTVALVLAGGRGARLHPLTDTRCKPAAPFGGSFRIIDFALSNCINSGIRRVGVLSQYEQHSLLQHLNDSWNFLRRDLNEFIDLLPARLHQGRSWYQGTADAIAQNIDILRSLAPRFTLVLAGDHIYKADYRRMIQYHVNTSAQITVASIKVPSNTACQFGVIGIDGNGRIESFHEKPAKPSCIPGSSNHSLVSMGIYVFNTELLIDMLEADANDLSSTHDFGHDIIPALIKKHRVMAYDFSTHQSEHYWRDVGTIDAYFDTNMQLLEPHPEMQLHDVHWPIRSLPVQLPAARFIFDDAQLRGMASDSIVAAGCVLRGARVRHTILFSDVQVNELSEIHNALLLPGVRIGVRCRIKNAIVDSNTHIPDNTDIGFNKIEDARRYTISDNGIVVVTATDDHRSLVGVSSLGSARVDKPSQTPLKREHA